MKLKNIARIIRRRMLFHRLTLLSLILIILICFSSCKKWIELPAPISGLSSSSVFANNNTATAAVTGMLQDIMSTGNELSGGNSGMSLKLGLSCDELVLNISDASLGQVFTNSLDENNGLNATSWTFYYRYIYQTNSILEGLSGATSLTKSLKDQLTGETKFVRALLYYYLINLYGDVPLILETDFRKNSLLPRSDVNVVKQQILKDLLDAEELLSDDYKDGTGAVSTERVRPNRPAVRALLSRFYLYEKDWENAERYSSLLLDNTSVYYLSTKLEEVFLKNSSEAILQFQPTGPGFDTYDGYCFILNSQFTPSSPTSISSDLLNKFIEEDKRKGMWLGEFNGFYFPNKYKVKGGYTGIQIDEYVMVFRLAEQFLIRAEARANKSDLGNAITDLNKIRNRAGLPNYSGAINKDSIIAAILDERAVELFCEMGARWFDLIRTGEIDKVMPSVSLKKGGKWSKTGKLFPIPGGERLKDPNLSQNLGY